MFIRIGLLGCAFLFVVACGADLSTPEGASEEATDVMNDMADVIKGVESTDDIDSAKSDMKDLVKRMNEIHDAYKKMSKDDQKAFDKKMRESRDSKKVQEAMKGKSPELQMALGMAMMEVMKDAAGDWMK